MSGRLTALSDGRSYPVPADGLLIGRHASCHVVLASVRASRRHARVMPGANGYTLHDESTNGVVVNGARVSGTALLKEGDIIGIGETAFRFNSDGDASGPDRSMFAGAPAAPRPTVPEPPLPTVPTENTPRAKRPDEKSTKK